MRFISAGKIQQFRDIVRAVKTRTEYNGKDENGNAIYVVRELPTITAFGTEKIHGTQMSVHYNAQDGFWVQSKKNIITPEQDNAGCAFYAMQRKDEWMDIIRNLADAYSIDLVKNTISVFAEWCGEGIQKNTAVQGLEERAMIFQHFKKSPIDENEVAVWLATTDKTKCESVDIYNLCDFPFYEIVIDFNQPGLAQNKIIEMLNKIELDSPVGRQFGLENKICEGFVFTFDYDGVVYKFKVKGEKHSKGSKVKTLKPVDNEKEQRKQECAQACTPVWRLEQMFDLANDVLNGGIPDIKNIGKFIKMINEDIIDEESDVIKHYGLIPKDIFYSVAKIIKPWYIEQLNNFAGI